MRHLLLGFFVLATTADRTSDRDALLAADRTLSGKTTELGWTRGFLPALEGGAAYLHPGAPLLRGTDQIRGFLETADSLENLDWSPAFGDVSADGRFGYTYGWTRSGGGGTKGKYLACWRKDRARWRIVAYARTKPAAVPDSVAAPRRVEPGAQVRGRADPGELLRADSAFAAISRAQGVKAAFLGYSTDDAILLGGAGPMSEGREAIGAAFDGFPSGAVLAWWPVAAAIAESGDLGCTVGEATIASLNHYSKYLTIWRRQRDGSWKFVADGGNVRPAPAP